MNVKFFILFTNFLGNEWCQLLIMDTMVGYEPEDEFEAFQICEKVITRLNHINEGVIMSSIKLLINLIDFLSKKEKNETIKKISNSICSLINSE